jgi:hypothetical protein
MSDCFVQIELLYFDNCPSYRQVWNDLLEVITKHKLGATVTLIYVDSLEKANALHFAGSPTVKVNGVDLENYQGEGVMACRVYEDNDRKGWPSKSVIAERLLEALGV